MSMKPIALLVVLPLAVSTMPLLAQTSANSTAQSERRVCRSFDRIGSNIRVRRVCLTEAQWAERDRLDRERVQDLANRPNMAWSYGGNASCQ